MMRDPRNPDPRFMVTSGSPQHADIRKTLVLLRIRAEPPVYFVVEGIATWPNTMEEMLRSGKFVYESHTCPTNFIRIPMIACGGDVDPHGVFEFVDAVWMMDEYEAAEEEGAEDEYLVEVFPQLGAPA